MSTTPRLTLIGLYTHDNTLFDSVTLPTGYNKNTFIDTLLLEHGEKCVLYPEPEFMKYSLGAVSRKWALELERLYEALTAEYNPIYNYDRFEESHDGHKKEYGSTTEADYNNSRTANLEDKRTANLEDKRTANLEDKRTADLDEKTTHDTLDTMSQTVDGVTEHKVSAYNSSGYEPSEQNTTNNGTSTLDKSGTDDVTTTGTDTMEHTGTDTMEHTGTDTTTHTGTDKTNIKGTLSDISGSESNINNHNAHMYGNIGVTTAASMVNEIVNQRMEKNLYALAARIFSNELLIQIY